MFFFFRGALKKQYLRKRKYCFIVVSWKWFFPETENSLFLGASKKRFFGIEKSLFRVAFKKRFLGNKIAFSWRTLKAIFRNPTKTFFLSFWKSDFRIPKKQFFDALFGKKKKNIFHGALRNKDFEYRKNSFFVAALKRFFVDKEKAFSLRTEKTIFWKPKESLFRGALKMRFFGNGKNCFFVALW